MFHLLRGVAATFLLMAVSPNLAFADLCRPSNVEHLLQLAASPSSPVEILSPKSRHLMTGVTAKVKISPGIYSAESPKPEDLRYRIFYKKEDRTTEGARTQPVGGISNPVGEIQNVDVSATPQATILSFRPDVKLGFTSLVIVGCSESVELESGRLPPHFAVINTTVTGKARGIIAAFFAALLMFIIIYFVANRNKAAYGMTFAKGLLYCFTNFKREVSLSRVQLFIFTLAVVVTAAYYFARSGELTDLSTDVLMLLGISSAGAVAGGWGDTMKNRLDWENWRWLDRHSAFQKTDKNLPLSLGQVIRTRGEFDLYRFQALVFTILVAPAFVFASFNSLGSAEIPEGILAVLGLSQVTYLVGKFAHPPTVTEFNSSIAETRKKLDEGFKLTDKGVKELKEQFLAAMGIEWAKPPEGNQRHCPKQDFTTLQDETSLENYAQITGIAAEAAQQAAKRARSVANTKIADKPAANLEADLAEKAAAAAAEARATVEKTTRALRDKLLVNVNTAKEAMRVAKGAEKDAKERLKKIEAMT